ncbi:response regulator [Dyadobacter aurulentus]|uniref:response regulator n=1 Tax=Dyadobacter sp. UC 10 TaxID=2605428 RepID=UPI0011F35FB6|nr:response regulator [Dyadobacter sp. UC 10]KAA0993665.1 response regulator [Dyadobacter sp. UC 10]
MSIKGPIISIEDDTDDQFLIQSVVDELNLPNKLIFFGNGLEALLYLETTQEQPFLIICDINMPVMNGLELRERIDRNEFLKRKAIPFIFLSTADNPHVIETAYNSTIQGFFKKENSFHELKSRVKIIYDYWQCCLHPNLHA